VAAEPGGGSQANGNLEEAVHGGSSGIGSKSGSDSKAKGILGGTGVSYAPGAPGVTADIILHRARSLHKPTHPQQHPRADRPGQPHAK
jgi:hypothetical protein